MNFVGKRIGKLVVLKKVKRSSWECKCDCGNITQINTCDIKRQHRKSCGCLVSNEDLTGRTFGRLTVLGTSRDSGKKLWECLCKCGNIIYTNTCRLTTGHNRSCGCGKKPNLIGKKFGKLLVIDKLDRSNKHKKRLWVCKCDCGKIIHINTTTLKTKQKSCGCERAITIHKKMWKGCGEISGIYWTKIKHGAASRNLPVDISIDYIWDLFLKQDRKCNLTGLPLCFESSSNKCDGTASLDRIDSSKGYIKDNVQWIYKDINPMKMALNEHYFIELCCKIADHSRKCV
jgi:hypothetical protein